MDNAISIVPIKFRDVSHGKAVTVNVQYPDSIVYRIQYGDLVYYRCIDSRIGDLVEHILEIANFSRTLCG